MNWYCVYTKPGRMDKALDNIGRQGLEAFYPKIRVQRVIRGKKQWVTRPMFPNYLFARLSLIDHYHLIQATRGVSRLVSFGGEPPPVPPDVIERLRSQEGEGLVLTLQPDQYRSGEKVRILDGPFAGFSAVFRRELKSRDRVILLLDLLKTSVETQVPRDSIVKD